MDQPWTTTRTWSTGPQTHKEIQRGKEKGGNHTNSNITECNKYFRSEKHRGRQPGAVCTQSQESQTQAARIGGPPKKAKLQSLTNKGRKEMSTGKPKTRQAEHRVASGPTTQTGRFLDAGSELNCSTSGRKLRCPGHREIPEDTACPASNLGSTEGQSCKLSKWLRSSHPRLVCRKATS